MPNTCVQDSFAAEMYQISCLIYSGQDLGFFTDSEKQHSMGKDPALLCRINVFCLLDVFSFNFFYVSYFSPKKCHFKIV